MTCEHIKLPGGGVAIVCSRGRRAPRCSVRGCDRPSARQCDFPTRPGKTCDRHLCAVHAVPQGQGRDYCPDHPVAPGVMVRADLFEELAGC